MTGYTNVFAAIKGEIGTPERPVTIQELKGLNLDDRADFRRWFLEAGIEINDKEKAS